MKTPRSLAPVARQLADAVVITDPDGYVDWVNPAFTKLTGYTLAELKGKKPGSVLQGPDTDSNAVRILHDAVHEGRSASTEILNYRKSGEPYVVAISLNPIFDRAGQLVGFMSVERETSAVQRELRRLENEVAQLYGILCHVTNERPA